MRTHIALDPWLDFACAVLAGLPKLDGAACVDVRGRFHEAEGGSVVRIAECIAICRRCPVVAQCADWADTQRDLAGVVAGKFRGKSRQDDETSSEGQ